MFKLIHGDCIKELGKLIQQDIKVDLTITSPPYDNLRNYNNTLKWDFQIFKKIADQLYEITANGGVVVWIVNDATINGSESIIIKNSFFITVVFSKLEVVCIVFLSCSIFSHQCQQS